MQGDADSSDLFEDYSPTKESSSKIMHTDDSISDNDSWRGTCMKDMLHDGNPWKYYTPPINPSRNHTVLFELPVTLSSSPKPHFSSSNTCHWNTNHVRMPFSHKNLYPIKNEDEETVRPRWELIQCALLQPITSSTELESAIFSYNLRHSKLHALHYFFEEILSEDESSYFFEDLLPKIVQLALQLPEVLPTPIPLLKQGKSHSISLSQLQICSILANAFLCTFPWRKDMTEYPGVNFNRLFECKVDGTDNALFEKIKCLMHYFRRVTTKTPLGVVTFERKHIIRSKLPRWDQVDCNIADTKLHITSSGTIEDDGLGLLQVDFANCMVGGGVLGWGCVQEEIRFIVCPELLVSRLFTERLAPTEAVLMIGIERFSKYKGYADSFQWDGNYEDDTPFDIYGRRRTSVVAIDALYYSVSSVQFSPSKMIRELNKAYVGYSEDSSISKTSVPAVATGNWGCGAFNGKIELKALLQIMACTVSKRNIVYYTFGNGRIRDSINNMHNFLTTHNITVSQLWHYLCRFNESKVASKRLFSFIQQAHLDYLKKCQNNTSNSVKPNNSKANTPNTCKRDEKEDKNDNITTQDSTDKMDFHNIYTTADCRDIEASPIKQSTTSRENIKELSCTFVSEVNKKEHFNKLKCFLYSSDEEENVPEQKDYTGLLQAVDNFHKGNKEKIDSVEGNRNESNVEQMDVCSIENEMNQSQIKNNTSPTETDASKNQEKGLTNKKISDYFKKVPK